MTEKTTPEPVAYFAKRQYGGVDLWEQVHAKYAHMSDVVPLYAHPPAAPTPKPVAWLIRWTERDTPCSMLVDGDPGPAAEDETITPLYTHPDERVAMLESLLREALTKMDHARIFIGTREKMHETGRDLYDELFERIRAALEGK
jgi:hypothetical protein